MQHRQILERLFKYWLVIAGFAVLYVFVDFAIDIRPPAVHSSYRFTVGTLNPDQARVLKQDNLSILVIRRSPETIKRLRDASPSLQDPFSSDSHQPEFATNPLRSKHVELFVSYAIGTDLGCPLRIEAAELVEGCGSARYDFAGRALTGSNQFQNLAIPDYNFDDSYETLTIRP